MYVKFKRVYLLVSSLFFSFTALNGCLEKSKQISETSTLKANPSEKLLTFVSLSGPNTKTVKGLMLNSNTIIVPILRSITDPDEKEADPILQATLASSPDTPIKATYYRGIYLNYSAYGWEKPSLYSNSIFLIYTTEQPISVAKEVSISSIADVSESNSENGPFYYQDDTNKFQVNIHLRSSRFHVVNTPAASQMKVGGALLDSKGALFGIVDRAMVSEVTCGLNYGDGFRLNQGAPLQSINQAISGFPTRAELNIIDEFHLFKHLINSHAVEYRKDIFRVNNVTVTVGEIDRSNSNFTLSAKKCIVHFNNYSQISFEDLGSKDLSMSTMFFANKDKLKLLKHEITTIDSVTKCLRQSLGWLPDDNKEVIRAIANSLDLYAKEQASRL